VYIVRPVQSMWLTTTPSSSNRKAANALQEKSAIGTECVRLDPCVPSLSWQMISVQFHQQKARIDKTGGTGGRLRTRQLRSHTHPRSGRDNTASEGTARPSASRLLAVAAQAACLPMQSRSQTQLRHRDMPWRPPRQQSHRMMMMMIQRRSPRTHLMAAKEEAVCAASSDRGQTGRA
jgi:hypothetical protein